MCGGVAVWAALKEKYTPSDESKPSCTAARQLMIGMPVVEGFDFYP